MSKSDHALLPFVQSRARVRVIGCLEDDQNRTKINGNCKEKIDDILWTWDEKRKTNI